MSISTQWITSDTTIDFSGVQLYLIAANSNNITITLPTVSLGEYGQVFSFARKDNTNNTVTIVGSDSQLIDSSSSVDLNPADKIKLVSQGQAWWSWV